MGRGFWLVVFACALVAGPLGTAAAPEPPPGTHDDVVRIDVTPAHRLRTLRPLDALGSTVDKEPAGSIPRLYSRENVRAMLDAGLGWLSYRLFTELSVQDWHWNPVGRFSAGREGYWIGSASTADPPVSDSFGYRLPHRGSTTDQGNNADYSRIDDGDPRTYWKSDPYLTSAYTGDPDAAHPQWVIVDLGATRPVDAIRIDWASPYATRYSVERWVGADAINDPAHGVWQAFPTGEVIRGHGGRATLRLAPRPLAARFVRVLMTASSNTCDTHGRGDRRNCVGYAIDELGLGTLDSSLRFNDFVHHAPCGGEKPGRQPCGIRQTAIYASSTDPWHDATSRVRDQEQPGLDLIARSGLTRGRPATYPVSMLYSTPENAVAEVRYLRARGYPIAQIELGEEPDGQYAEPEDYGALYVRWARAIHAVAPGLPLGGPVFSGVNADLQTWPDAHGEVSWLKRFLAYLRAHGAMNELAFMSFEHYPFDGCEHGAKLQADLLREPALIAGMAHTWRADGLPRTIPMEVTEANFSAVNFTQTPMQIEGALWLADYLAGALTAGVDRAVYYQYEPVPLSRNAQCPTDWGNLTMFAADDTAHIRARTAQFYGARMLTHEWLEPGDRVHALFPAATNMLRGNAPLVSAYAARRPDGTWSVLLVNKDMRAHDVRVEFADAARPGEPPGFTGTVRRTTFGPQQYVWRSRGAQSSPSPNAPPLATSVSGGPPSALHAAGTLADRAAWHFRGRGVDAMIALVLAALSGALVTMHVDTNPAHRIATIRPVRALGSAIDSDPQGKIPFLYTPARTRVMLDAGLGELSYRLYTELSIQDWHWNPSGTFSDAAHGRGYWTSSASTARTPIVDSFGYRLPRRGSTRDQGDDDDFSRMDDGDPATFWKSDPYLTSAYTHDPDVQHAQWAVLDFDRPRDVDAIRIAWAQPYATRYVVQWWSGPDAILDQGHGAWHTFPNGTVVGRRGGTALRRLADAPVRARFVRVLMTASSGTCDADGPGDPRNCMGYAIREIGFGRFGADGRFEDLVVHSRCGGPPPPAKPRCGTRQTTIFVSSIDPWHEAKNRTTRGQDQPGLDFVARNAITRGRPVMYPIPMLYSTPANAVAEVRYLRARGYPVAYVEMGEEADGQYVNPEDYAALYVQFARALHAFDPTLKLGGPVFEGVNIDVAAWADASGDTSFLHRFLRYLKRHGALGELAFMSFEHYPFKGCDRGALLHEDLLREPAMIRDIAHIWRADGLPVNVPMFVTEGNFAADGTSVPLRLEGALWMADYFGSAFSSGVTRIQHYQYEAEPIGRSSECGISTSYGMFITDAKYRIVAKAGSFYGAQMLAKEWLVPGDAPHDIYPVTNSLGTYEPAVTGYAAHRPDGTWSMLLVNKDRVARRVRITLGAGTLRGPVTIVSFGSAQYHWNDRHGAIPPSWSTGPVRRVVQADAAGIYTIPAESVTVVRGAASGG